MSAGEPMQTQPDADPPEHSLAPPGHDDALAPPGHEGAASSPGDEESPQGDGAPGPAAPKPVALDTDDTRGWHFRRYLGSKLTLIGGPILIIGAGVGGWIGSEMPAVGAAAAGGALLLVILLCFWAAINAATRDFFVRYAEQRGLTLHEGRGNLPAVTPLLKKGDRRYCENAMTGRLPGDFDGTLARYTYEVDTRDAEGDRQTSYYHFNVVVTDIPESSSKARAVYCERRSGFRFLDGAEDAFRRSTERVELESEELDKRYEVFRHIDDDPIYMREIFDPKFIVWLCDSTPEDFGFEFAGGTLCVSTKGHYDDGVALDAICEAAGAVRRRLYEEALEGGALADPTSTSA